VRDGAARGANVASSSPSRDIGSADHEEGVEMSAGTVWLTRARLAEIARYCAVGLTTFGLDEGCLILLHTSSGLPLFLDTAIAFALSSLVNFVFSRQWVFEQAAQGARPRTALVRYVVVIALGLLFTAAAVPALSAAGLDYRIGKLLVSGAVGIGNYFAFPWFVFRGRGTGPAVETGARTARQEAGQATK
jgi:putative flippase GtrA